MCIKGSFTAYKHDAEKIDSDELLDRLRKFETVWKGRGHVGKPRGGDYDIPTWRLFKLAHRQEAHRRGLGT